MAATVRRLAALVAVLAAVLGAVLGVGTPPAAAEAAPATPLALSVTAGKAGYRPGEEVTLRAVVTNRSGAACGLAGAADGALEIVGARRGAVEVQPSFSRTLSLDGTADPLARRVTQVPPGGSVSFTITGHPRQGLAVLTPLPDGSALTALWPLDARGRYELSLVYQLPPLAGAGACAGSSNVATVQVSVRGGAGRGWLLPTVFAAVLLVLAAALLVLALRGRRGRRSASTAIAVLAAVVVVGATGQLPARADITMNAGTSKAIASQFSGCLAKIAAVDPDLVKKLTGPGAPHVAVYPWTWSGREDLRGGSPRDSFIRWDNESTAPFLNEPSGAAEDPCASLYHELVHAGDAADGSLSNDNCGDTGVLYDEVRATAAENRYRAKNGLKQRTTYDGKKIPSSEKDCKKTKQPKDPRRKGNGSGGACRGASGGCGTTNGDPHLITFDGYFYDFQAVGEFVTARSTVDDLEIQTRQSLLPGSRTVSVNSAVALRVGPTRLGFYLTDAVLSVHRDGSPVTVATGDTALPGGAKLTRETNEYRMDSYVVGWADGSAAWIEPVGRWGLHVSVAPAAARKGALTGLLGDFDGKPDNDVVVRNGSRLPHPPRFEQLYPGYADGWRVSGAASLFDYAPGQSTGTFTDRTAPDRPATAADLPAPRREAAQAACRLLNVTNPALLDACILDVALTGQAAFAVTAGITQTVVPAATAVDGQAVTLRITQPGATARLTFAGTAGKRVYVQVLSTTLPDECGLLTLYQPDGRQLGSGCVIGGTGQIDGTVLPATGQYAVTAHSFQDNTGELRVRVVSTVDSSGALTPDGPEVTMTIGAPGAVAKRTFAGTAGQKVFVDVPSSTLPDQCGVVRLVGPGGGDILTGCVINGNGYVDTTPLPATGEYAIVVDPAGDAMGEARVRVLSVHDQEGSIGLNGPEVTGEISGPGAVSRWTFAGTAGQKVFVDVVSATLVDECGLVMLRDPDGRAFISGCVINGTGGINGAVLPTTGQYTLMVDPAQRHTGQIRLRLRG